MRSSFPLFNSHLDLAHKYWKEVVISNDIIIDATCGNGHDAAMLAKLPCLKLYALDIQKAAIDSSKEKFKKELSDEERNKIELIHGCHSSFPNEIVEGTVKLVVYNLGYLPGFDKDQTTKVSSTLKSIEAAIPLVKLGGLISITCYPGHPEGKIEQDQILLFTKILDPKEWSACHHVITNRKEAPSLLILQKKVDG